MMLQTCLRAALRPGVSAAPASSGALRSFTTAQHLQPGNVAPSHPEFHPDANITLRDLGVTFAPVPRVFDSDLVGDAVQKMVEANSATCLVVEKTQSMTTKGIITGRDLVRHFAQNDSSPLKLRCRELAVGNPVHVSQFASLECTLQLMRRHRIRTILVAPSVLGGISKEEEFSRNQLHADEVQGVVTGAHLIAPLMSLFQKGPKELAQSWEALTAAEMFQGESNRPPNLRMTSAIRELQAERQAYLGGSVTAAAGRSFVSPQDDVRKAVRVLYKERVGAVTVSKAADLDSNSGGLAGIFTSTDYLNSVLAKDLLPREVAVEDVMTPFPTTITPQYTMSQVGEIMATQNRKHLPLLSFIGDSMDNDSRVTDLITFRDLYSSARAATHHYYTTHDAENFAQSRK